jgi:hypothetical protein
MMKAMEIFRKHRRNHYSGMGQCFFIDRATALYRGLDNP